MALQVLFFGTSEFSIPTLEALASNPEIELKGVITQPDKQGGRNNQLIRPPVKIFAEEGNLPVMQPEKIKRNKELLSLIRKMDLDLIVVVSYGAILPKEILETPKYGSINIHPSLLPKYRGPSPMNETLLRGDKETGVSIIRMNEKMDEGDIIFIKKMEVEESDNYMTLQRKLSMMAGQLILPVLMDYTEGILLPIKQDPKKASYCKKMEKEDGKIDWKNETAEQIKNKIRAFIIWPSTYSYWKGKMIKIKKASVLKKDHSEKPGTAVFFDKTLAIACKENFLVPHIVQLEGKKEVPVEDFIRGYGDELRRNPLFGE